MSLRNTIGSADFEATDFAFTQDAIAGLRTDAEYFAHLLNMELCAKGSSTLTERLEIIRHKKENSYRQMAEFQKKIDYLEWKEQHYLQLIQTGAEDDCNPIQHK